MKWLDGIETGWAIPLLIVGFAAAWLLFLLVAYLSGDLHADVLEAWTVGRDLAWGNAKHPPLMGWIAHLWTLVFPLTDWSFQLLAMTNAAVALWAVDLITRRFARGDKRVVVLLLLMLLPAYQFHAQRFNANTVLLALWPLATYGFLRSFAQRSVKWGAIAGALAAFAMLGKYYSVFLVGSFVLAAICHPQRRAYFTSFAPWASTLAGFAVLGPHIHWLATSGAEPFEYAMTAHGGLAVWPSVREGAMFLLGLAATLALPALLWLLIAGTRLKRFAADYRMLDSGLLLLFWICVGTIVLPVITAISIGTELPSLWALQGLFLVAILVVCGASFAVERFHTVNLTVIVMTFAIVAVAVAAPAHALYRSAIHPEERAYYRLAAAELTRRWHGAVHTPLPNISGADELAFATAFYSPDHPRFSRPFRFQYNWGLPRVPTLEKGWAAMCFAHDTGCLAWMRNVTALSKHVRRFNFEVTPRFWGRSGTPAQITAMMVLPVGAGAESQAPADGSVDSD